LLKATYDAYSYSWKKAEGGPPFKFVYYIIKSKHPIEQGKLIN